eukprot:3488324-Rhodomonas_salina.2
MLDYWVGHAFISTFMPFIVYGCYLQTFPLLWDWSTTPFILIWHFIHVLVFTTEVLSEDDLQLRGTASCFWICGTVYALVTGCMPSTATRWDTAVCVGVSTVLQLIAWACCWPVYSPAEETKKDAMEHLEPYPSERSDVASDETNLV